MKLQIDGHEDDVNTVAFADGTSQILYSGGDDGICKVWDRRTLTESNPVPVGNLAGLGKLKIYSALSNSLLFLLLQKCYNSFIIFTESIFTMLTPVVN